MTGDLYRDRAARLDTVVGEDKAYWAMLGRIAVEVSSSANPDGVHIQAWCESLYGFRMIYDQDGGITDQIDIIDPQKYTLCLLKHGG